MILNFVKDYIQLPPCFYKKVHPTPFQKPFLIHENKEMGALIGINHSIKQKDCLEFFAGKRTIAGTEPIAMVYAGHQFGQYVPQLGDGRALLLAQVKDRKGHLWDIHLKGAGPTPYSRMGDGRAVLRSVIREYLGSEAMHGLGIPTTRSLCIIGGEEMVQRDELEPGAMMIRLSPSHIRFGTFEYFYYSDQHEALKQLLDYAVQKVSPTQEANTQGYLNFFSNIVKNTAKLIAKWQAIGFCHGVMNTDNMSILGLTIDYGPFGFLDTYRPDHICNTSDYTGRYAYNQQPSIALWNLMAFAQTLSPFVKQSDLSRELKEFQLYVSLYSTHIMRRKFGFISKDSQADDVKIMNDAFDIMADMEVDYTQFMRRLATDFEGLYKEWHGKKVMREWLNQYQNRLQQEKQSEDETKKMMCSQNPKYILRNYMLQTAIKKAYAQDYSEIERLFALIQNPYDEQPENDHYAQTPPEWAAALKVSCSS